LANGLCSMAFMLDTLVCSLLIELAFRLCLTASSQRNAQKNVRLVCPAVCPGGRAVVLCLSYGRLGFIVGSKKPVLLFSVIC
jgi:hypothetical protein